MANKSIHFKDYTKLLNTVGKIVIVLAIAGLVAIIWQSIDNSHNNDEYSLPKAFIRIVNSFNKEEDEETGDGAGNDTKEGSFLDFLSDFGNNETVEDTPPEIIPVGGIPADKKAASESVLERSLFVGDYFVSNIQAYCFKDTSLAYVSGYDLNYVLNKKLCLMNDEYVTLPQYVLSFEENVDDIYIALTAESVSWMDETTFKKKFESFIDEIINNMPEKTVYVLSIPPIDEEMALKRDYTVTNEKIDSINDYILSISGAKEFWFLDINSKLKDDSGKLNSDFTTNGIRLNTSGYEIFKNYILTHRA